MALAHLNTICPVGLLCRHLVWVKVIVYKNRGRCTKRGFWVGEFRLHSLRPLQLHCDKVVQIGALKLDAIAFPPREISSELKS